MRAAVSSWPARLRGLTLQDMRLLLEAQRDLLACQLAKWLRPVGRLLDWENASTGEDVQPVASLQTLRAVGWAVTRAASYGVFRPQCLVRSLAIQRMLRRRGIAGSTIRIGVRLQDGAFSAHAWVEVGGLVIGDSRAHVESFTRITDHRLVQL
ncbi:MAG TPA: lasso peptide biosynthesis B2 protein [Longimicrobiales bacterium]|nr:lasso peptide biosynthesis B2 protein [Longimicrobiales bacterium]